MKTISEHQQDTMELITKPVGYRLLKGYGMLATRQDPWEEN